MARTRNESTPTWKEDARQEKLAEVRERARQVAEIVVRLPADRSLIPGSEARAELLTRFGLTAATGADWAASDGVELVAETTDWYALWLGKDGPRWNGDGEHYSPSGAEVMQIAAEELDRCRLKDPKS